MDESRLSRRAGDQLRALRKKRGLSTRELASLAGISQPFLSQLERGISAPSMITVYRLAEALDVLPGALLPPVTDDVVTVVRADEGGRVPVAARADAVVGRTLQMRPDNVLEVIEYVIEPGRYIGEWFQLEGDLGVYVVSGTLLVEVEGAGSFELGPRDFIAHSAAMRHRWFLVGDEPAHVVLSLAHPAG
ncbi:helix-turn-helix domain-containing protein [Nocardia sp. NPDC004068]|uniref:helix-turn-helix domain-containing protein n=1 Tax=Nocardia sp. NPDC004068 TaxID=3364303 RepID=UPI0036B544D4